MKKPKKVLTKIIVGTVSSSILIASCKVGDYNLDGNKYGPMADNNPEGVRLLDVSESNLSDEFLKKIKAISSIVEEVLSDRNAAKQFCDSPELYLAAKEEALSIVLTDEDKRVLRAFSDEDIIEAVKSNDMAEFLRIGRERGYIGLVTTRSPEEIRSIFRSEQDYKEFMMALEEGGGPTTRAAGVGLVVVAVAAAAIYAAVETMAAVQVGVVYHVGFWTKTAGPTGESQAASSLVMDREPVLKLWMDNNGTVEADVFYREIIDSQVDSMFEIARETYPNIDEDMFKNIVRSNLETYYGFNKTK